MRIKHFDLPPGKTLEQLIEEQRARSRAAARARYVQNYFKLVAESFARVSLQK